MVLFPRARVLALVPLGFFLQVMELPAKVFLLFWFGLQLFSAFVSTEGMGGVAWWAHIGGFVAGAALARPFARRR
jgi:membrane associated rhomboid family serine protease